MELLPTAWNVEFWGYWGQKGLGETTATTRWPLRQVEVPPVLEVLFMECLSGSNREQTSIPKHGVGILRLGTLNFGDIGGKRGSERPLPPLDGP